MDSRLRSTSAAKWACALLMLSILACWAFAPSFGVDLAESHSLQIAERSLRIFLWPSPRSAGDPDCWTIPLWFPAALIAPPTLLAWWLDRRAAHRDRARDGAPG